MKHFLRRIVLRMYRKTNLWVVPAEVAKLIDDERFDEARTALDALRVKWPDDPEVVYYQSLGRFFE